MPRPFLRYLRLMLLVPAVLIGLHISPALALGVIDQQQLSQLAPGSAGNFIAIWNETSVGQTFAIGISGQLDAVAVAIESSVTPAAPLILDIRAVDSSDRPTGPILASATLAPPDVPTFSLCCPIPAPLTTIGLVPAVQVLAGQRYAFLLHSTDPTNHYVAVHNTGNPYSSGQLLLRSTGFADWAPSSCCDLVFQTFVASAPGPKTRAANVRGTGSAATTLGPMDFSVNISRATVGGPITGTFSKTVRTNGRGLAATGFTELVVFNRNHVHVEGTCVEIPSNTACTFTADFYDFGTGVAKDSISVQEIGGGRIGGPVKGGGIAITLP